MVLKQSIFFIIAVLPWFFLIGCGHSQRTETLSPEEVQAQKIDNLSNTISRVQSRLEELDAKISALTDKLEATKITVDNISGNLPIKTQPIVNKENGNPSLSHPAEVEPSALASPNTDVVADFQEAMKLLDSKKYTESLLAFQRFTENYPNHILAGSAQFYIGESYFEMHEYKLALGEYEKVASAFSSSPRVASALVRKAHCHKILGEEQQANASLTFVKQMFKGNPSLDWSILEKQHTEQDQPKSDPAVPPLPHSMGNQSDTTNG